VFSPFALLRSAMRIPPRLAIEYFDEHERRTARVVWPIELGLMDRARVLAAWCEIREDRFFRTERILSAGLLNRYPARRTSL
jgi:predicted DNA-binding transcriptional regulator YafY